jgi:sugar lactone lactonase YvrE
MSLPLAPPLPDSLDWLNAGTPLREPGRRGRLTALAFFNVGSAWSMQALAELQATCARHPQRLRGIGVHVPRFHHERDPRRVLKRLHRHGLTLPVAHDADWVAWQQYGAGAWPSIALVDEEGRIACWFEGDAGSARLEARIEAWAGGRADPGEPAAPIARQCEPDLPLRFPVGLAVAEQYLYVADCGHNRILECTHGGRLLRQFGSGDAGFIDGAPDQAALCRPHGICLLRGVLYVADTGNHAVRRIDLRSGEVSTLCGNGRRGTPVAGEVRDARQVALDGPRAVAAMHDQLHIAMSGDNRVWSYDLGRARLSCSAGSGRLEVHDGAGAQAAFGQPVALAAVQQVVYVCDAAGSAIRSLQLRDQSVQTLVGQGPWEFGDADGERTRARLQDPQAIALDPDAPLLWIADTGNDRLRALRLGGGELSTCRLPRRLHGPAGLAAGAGAVWIADTDAHAVLRMDARTGELHHLPIGE